jgi:Domain of unknown function (DUF4232)
VRVVSGAVLAALVGAGVFYAAAASGRPRIAVCSAVHVSGGNFNALTGGAGIAGVQVRNVGKRDCTINGRPWIRLGPTRHPLTVADAGPGTFGSFGSLERVLRLHAGQHAVAQVIISPGSCSQAPGTLFTVRTHAGWAERSVPIDGAVCKNGSGQILVGAFKR